MHEISRGKLVGEVPRTRVPRSCGAAVELDTMSRERAVIRRDATRDAPEPCAGRSAPRLFGLVAMRDDQDLLCGVLDIARGDAEAQKGSHDELEMLRK